MILYKNNGNNTPISIQKPSNFDAEYYTLLLQNTTTKEIYQYIINGEHHNQLYCTFNVDLSGLINGEYYLLLISNPNRKHIEVSYNNVENIKEEEVIFLVLVNKGDIITNGNLIIGTETNLKILTKELLKIGDCDLPRETYNKEQKYITYNG